MRRSSPTYDVIGRNYSIHRRPDPRIAARINTALADAQRVLNVGAGSGSYEPRGLPVVATEPSRVMIAQRRGRSTRVVRGVAEALPFFDKAFDVAMAVFTIHHWKDLRKGLSEMRRVSRRQLILTFDQQAEYRFWLVSDYFPEIATSVPFTAARFEDILSEMRPSVVEPILIPHDCVDGFLAAYWRRPAAYLDPAKRACISSFAMMDAVSLSRGLTRLSSDLRSGRWARKNAHLKEQTEYDGGYRLLLSES
ncbi:MAG TPA: class I SAM-dependent methyltransferase [Thermoplasmata archaeon]|nr:class I SAM-dependent methyltransferase [Thermoplasmata archaeon]